MDKVELTISIERERMDVLSFFLRDKDNSSVQKEMEQALQELYERCVPEETRRYVDSRCKTKATSQSKPKKASPQKPKLTGSVALPAAQKVDANG